MDILLDIPYLMEQLTAMQSCAFFAASETVRRKLIGACEVVEAALNRWGLDAGMEILRFDSTAIGLPLPTPLGGGEFVLVHLSIIYWFIGMMLGSIKSVVLRPSPLADIETLQVEALAEKCANAIPLLFEASAGLSENMSGLMALSICLRYFTVMEGVGRESEGKRTLLHLLDRDLIGSSVGKLLKRMNGDTDVLQALHQGNTDPARPLGWF